MAKQRNELLQRETLLDGWSKVVRVQYRQHRRDGGVEIHDRDLLDRGDGVAILLHNRKRNTILLVKQPRISATLRGSITGETIEICCGQVGPETPLEAALREVHEELGYEVNSLDLMAAVFASPGASLELVHIYFGEYDDGAKISEGGGLQHEGEDIEVVEVEVSTAMRWAGNGTIQDARSILALHLALSGGRM